MRYRLRDNLFCCALEHRLVLLDLARDRYFRLPPRKEAVLTRYLIGDKVTAEDLQELLAPGIIGSAPEGPSPLPPVPAPRDLVLPAELRPRRRDVVRALSTRIAARRRLRREGLVRLLQEIRPVGRHGGNVAPCAAARFASLAAAFAASRALLRSQDQCLPDSIAMMALCRREALDVTLIFGVRLDPFAAHCWVQADDVVITGDVDDARMCTPILALP